MKMENENKQYVISREMYKKIKSMDREQLVFVSGDTDKKMTKKEMVISEKLMKFKEIYAQ